MSKSIDILLSGGAVNTDPNLSLGGFISATPLLSQTPVYNSTAITGVSLTDATNIGSVSLFYTFNGQTLRIDNIPDTGAGQEVVAGADGVYVLPNVEGDKTLTVTVVAASLPVADDSQQVDATVILHNLYDEVTALNSQQGKVSYRHIYLKNVTLAPIQIAIYFLQQLNGLDYLEIGFENTSSGTSDSLMADELSPIAGIIFNAPTTLLEAEILTIAAGGAVGMFLKRTVLSLTDVATPEDSAIFEIVEVV